MKAILLSSLFGLMTLTAGPAGAQSSGWNVSSLTRASGAPGCSMSISDAPYTVAFEWDASRPRTFLAIVVDQRWQMERRLNAPLRVGIDGAWFNVTATTARTRTGHSAVAWHIGADVSGEFFARFANGQRMAVRFDNGAVGVDVSLVGTFAAREQMLLCMADALAETTRPPNPAVPPSASRPANPASPDASMPVARRT